MSAGTLQDFLVQWHLTGRCNLRCRHCYQEEYSGEAEPRAGLEMLDEAAETVEAWSREYGLDFTRSLTLTGGEPMLRPDLPELVRAARDRGFEVAILTNGTLVDKASARTLARAGVSTVQVSLEGPGDVHDEVRGRGSFEAALAGAARLAEAGVEVTLNATLSLLNADRLAELPAVARTVRARRLGLSRLVPAGRGQGLRDLTLSADRLGELYRGLVAMDTGGVELVTSDPLAMPILFPGEAPAVDAPHDRGDVPVGGCSAGVSGITVMPDLTLLPCRRLPIPLGNLRADSLREVWASSPVLEALRDRSRYGTKCRECARWASCRGCRAVAMAAAGDYLASDPGCFM